MIPHRYNHYPSHTVKPETLVKYMVEENQRRRQAEQAFFQGQLQHRPLPPVVHDEVRGFARNRADRKRPHPAYDARNWKLDANMPAPSRRLARKIKDTRIQDQFVWVSELPIQAAKNRNDARAEMSKARNAGNSINARQINTVLAANKTLTAALMEVNMTKLRVK